MALAIESGFPVNAYTVAAGTSFTKTIATAGPSLILVGFHGNGDSNNFPLTSITGSSLGTLTKITGASGNRTFASIGGEWWWKISSAALASEVITATSPLACRTTDLVVYSITGFAASPIGASANAGASDLLSLTVNATAGNSFVFVKAADYGSSIALTANSINSPWDENNEDGLNTVVHATGHAVTTGAGNITVGAVDTPIVAYATAVEILASAGAGAAPNIGFPRYLAPTMVGKPTPANQFRSTKAYLVPDPLPPLGSASFWRLQGPRLGFGREGPFTGIVPQRAYVAPTSVGVDLAGSIGAASAFGGDIAIAEALAGSIAGAATLKADAALAEALAGSIAGAAALVGALTLIEPLQGGIAGVATLSGGLTLAVALSGSIAGTTALAGSASLAEALQGSVASTTALVGRASLAEALQGTVAGTAALSATLTLIEPLQGAIGGASALTGSLSETIALQGAVASVSTLPGSLSLAVVLAGSIGGAAALKGDLQTQTGSPLAGSIGGASAGAGRLTEALALAGAIAGSAAIPSTLSETIALQGTMAGAVALPGSLTLAVVLSGGIGGATGLKGDLQIQADIALAGSIGGTATGVGRLSEAIALVGAIVGGSAFTSEVPVAPPATTSTRRTSGGRLIVQIEEPLRIVGQTRQGPVKIAVARASPVTASAGSTAPVPPAVALLRVANVSASGGAIAPVPSTRALATAHRVGGSGVHNPPDDAPLMLALFYPQLRLAKVAKVLPPIDRERHAVLHAQAAIKAHVHAFLHHLAVRLAAIARGAQMHKMHIAKSGADDEVKAAADAADFEQLGNEIAPYVRAVAKDGALEGLRQVGADIDKMLSQANERAVIWANDHAGVLVQGIGTTTRERIAELTAQALDEGWTNNELADEISGAGVFSEARAEMVARTETAFADVQGSLIGWKESDVVEGKKWLTSADACDECEALDGEEVPLDDDFPEGDPPLHPNCRCDVLPVLADDAE